MTEKAPGTAAGRAIRAGILRLGQVRLLGIAVLLLLMAVFAWGDRSPDGPLPGARNLLFDSYQRWFPREWTPETPVTIVDIDEKSLQAIGQWPWPRTAIARLIDAIAGHGPAVIGLDIIMAEPDRHSPENADWLAEAPPPVRRWADSLPSNDSVLAQAIDEAPVVLGIAATSEGDMVSELETPGTLKEPDCGETAFDPRPWLLRKSRVITSLPILNQAAMARGLISANPDSDGVYRSVPHLALIGDEIETSLTLQMVRLSQGASWLTPRGECGKGLDSVEMAWERESYFIPVRPDGSMRVHFSPSRFGRFVSAVDVLNGTVDPGRLAGFLVLVGVTGIGLQDDWATPTAALMPGVEIHAQVLENIFEGVHLHRPAWALPLELGLLALGGALMILVVPRVSPRYLFVPWPAAMAVMMAVGLGAYLGGQWLVDVSTPMIGVSIVFLVMLSVSLIEADRQRRRYLRDLAVQRERDARIAGELEAARRIQMGSLPNTRDISDPLDRFEVHGVLEPATNVAGDLYDVFLVDANTLFFMVGDVAGKGIPACLFMALSKSLYKSIALRDGTDIDDVMTIANAELSWDNPEMLFITAWAGLLDLNTGRLAFCNAGHDTPFLLSRSGALSMLDCEGGPPLCVLDDYRYLKEVRQLSPGDCLILTTDGVSEAMGEDHKMYTSDRVRALLRTMAPGTDAQDLVEALHGDVRTHVGQADPSDDITILALKWKAPL